MKRNAHIYWSMQLYQKDREYCCLYYPKRGVINTGERGISQFTHTHKIDIEVKSVWLGSLYQPQFAMIVKFHVYGMDPYETWIYASMWVKVQWFDIFPGASVGIMPLPTYKWFMNSLIAMDKALVIAISCTASMVMVHWHSSWREIKSILQ